MDSEQAESDVKPDFDDSGCVQDATCPGSPKKPAMENGYTGQASLLDLSDDVLLCILKYCTPHDLKALGFTCSRLGSLVLERSLWSCVDARGVGYGKARARWLLAHALHDGTQELKLSGFARQARGCLGYVNKTRKQVEDEIAKRTQESGGDGDNNNTTEHAASSAEEPSEGSPEPPDAPEPPYPLFRQHARLHINAHQLPRMSGSPTWHEESDSDSGAQTTEPTSRPSLTACAGPHFTLTAKSMRALRDRCPYLTSMSLDYCNINCKKMSINNFPPTLKKLSLRGTKCYNLPLDKSFLFKIHDYLPLLEFLDLSECEWLEPAALLPLSKISTLKTLLMRDCPGMSEFVAYVSLATRYGFRKLRVLDFRGSPVGDSEVSALGWLPQLEELYLSAPGPAPTVPTHEHYRGDPSTVPSELEAWELEEPDYYAGRNRSDSQSPDSSTEDVDDQVEQMRQRFNQPTDHISIEVFTRPRFEDQRPSDSAEPREPPPKRKVEVNISTQTDDSDAGPSKRTKTDESPKEKEEKSKKANKYDEACCSKDGRLSIEITFGFSDSPSGNGVQDKSRRDSGKASETVEDSEKKDDSDSEKKCDNDSGTLKEKSSGVKEETSEQKTLDSDDKSKRQDSDKVTSDDAPSKKSRKSDDDSQEDNDHKRKFNVGASTSRDCHTENFVDEPPSKKIRRHSGKDTKDKEQKSIDEKEKETKEKIKDRKRKRKSKDKSSDNSSSDDSSDENPGEGPSRNGDQGPDDRHVIHIVRNQDPVVIQCPVQPREEQLEPRHHVLYVNLGQQLHAVYRLLPNRPLFRQHRSRHYLSASTERLDSSSLVTDSAIRRFGRADGEDVNIVHIGPNGPQIGGRDTSGRPNRSNLRILSATGYRSITNRSLVHLATAAPQLHLIDFTDSGVTEEGVENFRSLRPDCDVRYSTFKVENNDEELNM